MALSRSTRVNILIGNGHFLSHFYVLCLPPMFLAWQDAFHVSFAELGMTVALMSGTTAILQTPVGFLVDRHGARMFLIGGALLMPGSLAILQASFRPDDRSAAIGAWSGLGGVANAAGPLVGGYLLAIASWRWVFVINLPLAAAVIAIASMGRPRRLRV